jgi:hypothetical protein
MPALLTREQAPIGDSEAGTSQTVARMAEHIRNSATDDAVRAIAGQALASVGGPGAPPSQRCKGVFYLIKARVRFQTDDQLISLMQLGQDELELLISPPVLLRSKRPVGDCDDFTMLCCALLHELGVPTEIVTVKADQPDPDRWSHVYCCAQTEQGPMILDTSHGDYPGWEVPHYYAKRYWDSRSGAPVRSEGGRVPQPRRRTGLHGYTRARRGMGATDPITGQEVDANGNPIDTSGTIATDPMSGLTYSLPSAVPSSSAPSPLAAGFAANLSNIINQGFKTLNLSLLPTNGYLVQNANGSYTMANGAAPNSLNLGTSSLSGMLPILLIGGGLLLVVGMMGKK